MIESWKRLNPNHTHHLWDDEDMRKFVVQVSTAAQGKALIKQLRSCAACTHRPHASSRQMVLMRTVCWHLLACTHSRVLPACPSAALP